MSNPEDVEFCPSRANLDWSKIQCADVSSIQVTEYAPVKYFHATSDSEDANEDDVEVDDVDTADLGEEPLGEPETEPATKTEAAPSEAAAEPQEDDLEPIEEVASPTSPSFAKGNKAKKEKKKKGKASKASTLEAEPAAEAEPQPQPEAEAEVEEEWANPVKKGKKSKGKKKEEKAPKAQPVQSDAEPEPQPQAEAEVEPEDQSSPTKKGKKGKAKKKEEKKGKGKKEKTPDSPSKTDASDGAKSPTAAAAPHGVNGEDIKALEPPSATPAEQEPPNADDVVAAAPAVEPVPEPSQEPEAEHPVPETQELVAEEVVADKEAPSAETAPAETADIPAAPDAEPEVEKEAASATEELAPPELKEEVVESDVKDVEPSAPETVATVEEAAGLSDAPVEPATTAEPAAETEEPTPTTAPAAETGTTEVDSVPPTAQPIADEEEETKEKPAHNSEAESSVAKDEEAPVQSQDTAPVEDVEAEKEETVSSAPEIKVEEISEPESVEKIRVVEETTAPEPAATAVGNNHINAEEASAGTDETTTTQEAVPSAVDAVKEETELPKPATENEPLDEEGGPEPVKELASVEVKEAELEDAAPSENPTEDDKDVLEESKQESAAAIDAAPVAEEPTKTEEAPTAEVEEAEASVEKLVEPEEVASKEVEVLATEPTVEVVSLAEGTLDAESVAEPEPPTDNAADGEVVAAETVEESEPVVTEAAVVEDTKIPKAELVPSESAPQETEVPATKEPETVEEATAAVDEATVTRDDAQASPLEATEVLSEPAVAAPAVEESTSTEPVVETKEASVAETEPASVEPPAVAEVTTEPEETVTEPAETRETTPTPAVASSTAEETATSEVDAQPTEPAAETHTEDESNQPDADKDLAEVVTADAAVTEEASEVPAPAAESNPEAASSEPKLVENTEAPLSEKVLEEAEEELAGDLETETAEVADTETSPAQAAQEEASEPSDPQPAVEVQEDSVESDGKVVDEVEVQKEDEAAEAVEPVETEATQPAQAAVVEASILEDVPASEVIDGPLTRDSDVHDGKKNAEEDEPTSITEAVSEPTVATEPAAEPEESPANPEPVAAETVAPTETPASEVEEAGVPAVVSETVQQTSETEDSSKEPISAEEPNSEDLIAEVPPAAAEAAGAVADETNDALAPAPVDAEAGVTEKDVAEECTKPEETEPAPTEVIDQKPAPQPETTEASVAVEESSVATPSAPQTEATAESAEEVATNVDEPTTDTVADSGDEPAPAAHEPATPQPAETPATEVDAEVPAVEDSIVPLVEAKSEKAAESEQPSQDSEEPSAAEEPAVIERAAASEEPAIVEVVVAVEEPTLVEEPAPAEEPAPVEEPAIVDEPAQPENAAEGEKTESTAESTVAAPAAVEEPAIGKATVTEAAATTEEPTDTQETSVDDEPAKSEESGIVSLPEEPMDEAPKAAGAEDAIPTSTPVNPEVEEKNIPDNSTEKEEEPSGPVATGAKEAPADDEDEAKDTVGPIPGEKAAEKAKGEDPALLDTPGNGVEEEEGAESISKPTGADLDLQTQEIPSTNMATTDDTPIDTQDTPEPDVAPVILQEEKTGGDVESQQPAPTATQDSAEPQSEAKTDIVVLEEEIVEQPTLVSEEANAHAPDDLDRANDDVIEFEPVAETDKYEEEPAVILTEDAASEPQDSAPVPPQETPKASELEASEVDAKADSESMEPAQPADASDAPEAPRTVEDAEHSEATDVTEAGVAVGAETAKTAEESEAAEGADVAQSRELIEAAEVIEQDQPTKQVDAEPLNISSDSAEATEPTKAAEASEMVEGLGSVEPQKPHIVGATSESPTRVETLEPAEAVETTETAEPVETVAVFEPAAAVDAEHTPERAEPAEANDIVEPSESVESVEPPTSTEFAEPATTSETVAPVEVPEPPEPVDIFEKPISEDPPVADQNSVTVEQEPSTAEDAVSQQPESTNEVKSLDEELVPETAWVLEPALAELARSTETESAALEQVSVEQPESPTEAEGIREQEPVAVEEDIPAPGVDGGALEANPIDDTSEAIKAEETSLEAPPIADEREHADVPDVSAITEETGEPTVSDLPAPDMKSPSAVIGKQDDAHPVQDNGTIITALESTSTETTPVVEDVTEEILDAATATESVDLAVPNASVETEGDIETPIVPAIAVLDKADEAEPLVETATEVKTEIDTSVQTADNDPPPAETASEAIPPATDTVALATSSGSQQVDKPLAAPKSPVPVATEDVTTDISVPRTEEPVETLYDEPVSADEAIVTVDEVPHVSTNAVTEQLAAAEQEEQVLSASKITPQELEIATVGIEEVDEVSQQALVEPPVDDAPPLPADTAERKPVEEPTQIESAAASTDTEAIEVTDSAVIEPSVESVTVEVHAPVDEPVAQQSVAESALEKTVLEPVSENQISEVVGSGPVSEKPIAVQSVQDEPATQEAVSDEPTAAELIHEPIIRESVAEVPGSDDAIPSEPVAAQELTVDQPVDKSAPSEPTLSRSAEEDGAQISLSEETVSDVHEEAPAPKSPLIEATASDLEISPASEAIQSEAETKSDPVEEVPSDHKSVDALTIAGAAVGAGALAAVAGATIHSLAPTGSSDAKHDAGSDSRELAADPKPTVDDSFVDVEAKLAEETTSDNEEPQPTLQDITVPELKQQDADPISEDAAAQPRAEVETEARTARTDEPSADSASEDYVLVEAVSSPDTEKIAAGLSKEPATVDQSIISLDENDTIDKTATENPVPESTTASEAAAREATLAEEPVVIESPTAAEAVKSSSEPDVLDKSVQIAESDNTAAEPASPVEIAPTAEELGVPAVGSTQDALQVEAAINKTVEPVSASAAIPIKVEDEVLEQANEAGSVAPKVVSEPNLTIVEEPVASTPEPVSREVPAINERDPAVSQDFSNDVLDTIVQTSTSDSTAPETLPAETVLAEEPIAEEVHGETSARAPAEKSVGFVQSGNTLQPITAHDSEPDAQPSRDPTQSLTSSLTLRAVAMTAAPAVVAAALPAAAVALAAAAKEKPETVPDVIADVPSEVVSVETPAPDLGAVATTASSDDVQEIKTVVDPRALGSAPAAELPEVSQRAINDTPAESVDNGAIKTKEIPAETVIDEANPSGLRTRDLPQTLEQQAKSEEERDVSTGLGSHAKEIAIGAGVASALGLAAAVAVSKLPSDKEPKTAKTVELLEEYAAKLQASGDYGMPASRSLGDVKTLSAESSQIVDETVPLSESFHVVEREAPAREEAATSTVKKEASSEYGEEIVAPSTTHGGIQTDDAFPTQRPLTPTRLIPRGLNLEFRVPTPAVVLPDLDDPVAKQMSRARSIRRQRRNTIKQAEEMVAAAVVIYATAEVLSPPASPTLSSPSAVFGSNEVLSDPAGKGKGKDVETPILPRQDSSAPGLEDEGRGRTRSRDIGAVQEGELLSSVADLSVDDKEKTRDAPKVKTDDKAPSSPRRSSHHSSRHRSHRDSRDGSKEGSRHSHRHRSDSHISSRSKEARPRTPTRQDSGFSERSERTSSSSHRKHRTPEEQEAHDKRKEERRRLRELEKAKEEAAPGSPNKDRSAPKPSSGSRDGSEHRRHHSHHSSRRHSRASMDPKVDKAEPVPVPASPAASKKFFDIKNGESIIESNFPTKDLAASTTSTKPPPELKRSSTKLRKSEDRSSRLRRSRDEVGARAKETRDTLASAARTKETLSSAAKTKESLASAARTKESVTSVGGTGSSTSGDGDGQHRARRQERRKEREDKEKKPGIRAAIKRFFTT